MALPALAAAFLCSCITAQASALTLTGEGFGGAVDVVASGAAETVFAGQLKVTVDGRSMIAFCVDFFGPISHATYNNSTGDPSGYANGVRAAWILENYAAAITTNFQAQAMQLALWDVAVDNGNGLGAANFAVASSVSSSLKAAADAIVLASAGRSSNYATILYNTVPLPGGHVQTLITTESSVPEPSAAAMFGLGCALMGVALRRRKRVSK